MLGLRRFAHFIVSFVFVFVPSHAMALNTNEPISPDKYNIEAYLAFEGMGADDMAVSNEIAFAFGITDRLDLVLGVSQGVEASGSERPNISTSLGVMVNFIDTEIFDVDLMLDFSVVDIAKSPEYIVTPSFEFNFDADPEMLTWGIYARIGLPMYAVKEDEGFEARHAKYYSKVDLIFTLGCYCWLGESHHFLLEQSLSVVDFSKDYRLEPLAFGYNYVIKDDVGLITEAAFTLPVNGAQFAAHLVIGFIWAL